MPRQHSWMLRLVIASDRLTPTLSASHQQQQHTITWAGARTGKSSALTWSEKLAAAEQSQRDSCANVSEVKSLTHSQGPAQLALSSAFACGIQTKLRSYITI